MVSIVIAVGCGYILRMIEQRIQEMKREKRKVKKINEAILRKKNNATVIKLMTTHKMGETRVD